MKMQSNKLNVPVNTKCILHFLFQPDKMHRLYKVTESDRERERVREGLREKEREREISGVILWV